MKKIGIEAAGLRGGRHRRETSAVIRTIQDGRIDDAAGRIRAIVAVTGVAGSKGSTAALPWLHQASAGFPAYQDAGVFETGGMRYTNSVSLHTHVASEHALEGP